MFVARKLPPLSSFTPCLVHCPHPCPCPSPLPQAPSTQQHPCAISFRSSGFSGGCFGAEPIAPSPREMGRPLSSMQPLCLTTPSLSGLRFPMGLRRNRWECPRGLPAPLIAHETHRGCDIPSMLQHPAALTALHDSHSGLFPWLKPGAGFPEISDIGSFPLGARWV